MLTTVEAGAARVSEERTPEDRAGAPPTRLGLCKVCVFWGTGKGSGLAAGLGHCRFNAPYAVADQAYQRGVSAWQVPVVAVATAKWPVTRGDDWCGVWAGS